LSGPFTYPIPGGDVQIEFGVNRWVLVETPDEQSVQRQVAHEPELAGLLRELGLTDEDARKAAAEAWMERPVEADTTAARSSESLRRSAGGTSWGVGAVLLIFLAALVAVVIVIVLSR
jgi:hypothetical protein